MEDLREVRWGKVPPWLDPGPQSIVVWDEASFARSTTLRRAPSAWSAQTCFLPGGRTPTLDHTGSRVGDEVLVGPHEDCRGAAPTGDPTTRTASSAGREASAAASLPRTGHCHIQCLSGGAFLKGDAASDVRQMSRECVIPPARRKRISAFATSTPISIVCRVGRDPTTSRVLPSPDSIFELTRGI